MIGQVIEQSWPLRRGEPFQDGNQITRKNDMLHFIQFTGRKSRHSSMMETKKNVHILVLTKQYAMMLCDPWWIRIRIPPHVRPPGKKNSFPPKFNPAMSTTEKHPFDDTPRAANSIGAIEKISSILEASGMDACSALYDEALTLAKEGLLGASRDRLRTLLCLNPDDGEAHLLLTKVFAAQERWSDALSQLEAARSSRVPIPASIQAEVEKGLRTEREAAEVHHRRVATREQAELHSLRLEAKRLRTENTRVYREKNLLKRRLQGWSGLTAVLSGVCLTLLVLLWFNSGDDDAMETVPIAEAPQDEDQPVVASTSTEGHDSKTAEKPIEHGNTVLSDAVPTTSNPRPSARSSKTHKVKKGDTLYEIAGKYYGDSTKWKSILEANRSQLNGRTRLNPGMTLVIPAT